MCMGTPTVQSVTTALYRRYRPDTFEQVIGQNHVTDPLRAALKGNRITHAYLFSGPRGCGKTTCARILARCLNCAQGPTDVPCGECESCVELATGGPGSLDVVEIDAASHNGVDDARELRERAAFAPVRDRYKVFILDEAHMVTSQGFNALLKLVEEPPDHVKFIFATTEPEKVIGTIRSRTHHYPFRLVPPEILEPYLRGLCADEGIRVGEGVLPLVIRAGEGSVRDTLSVLDQLMAGATAGELDYHQTVALLGYTDATFLDGTVDALASRDGEAAFGVVERVVESGHEPRRFVEDLLQRLRDLLVIAVAGEQADDVFPDVPADQLERMKAQAWEWGASSISAAADLTDQTLRNMGGATSPRLQVELLMGRILLQGTAPADAGASAPVPQQAAGAPVPPTPMQGASAPAPQGAFGPGDALRALREKTGKAETAEPAQAQPAVVAEPPAEQRQAEPPAEQRQTEPPAPVAPRSADVPPAPAPPVGETQSGATAWPAAQQQPPAAQQPAATGQMPVQQPAATGQMPVQQPEAPAPVASAGGSAGGDISGQWEQVLQQLDGISRVAGGMVRSQVQFVSSGGGTVTVSVPDGIRPRFEAEFKGNLEQAIQQATGQTVTVVAGNGPSHQGPGEDDGPNRGGGGGPSGPPPVAPPPMTGQIPQPAVTVPEPMPPAAAPVQQDVAPEDSGWPAPAVPPAGHLDDSADSRVPAPSQPAPDDPFATGWGPVAVPGGGASEPVPEPVAEPEPMPEVPTPAGFPPSQSVPEPPREPNPVAPVATDRPLPPEPAPTQVDEPAPVEDMSTSQSVPPAVELIPPVTAFPDRGTVQAGPAGLPADEDSLPPAPEVFHDVSEPAPVAGPFATGPATDAPDTPDAPDHAVGGAGPATPPVSAAEDTSASLDDEDADESHDVGLPAILSILGGTVVEEKTTEEGW